MGMIGRLHGDSVGVWDRRRKRVTVFSKTGEPRTGQPATVPGELVPAVGWLEDGSLVVTSTITPAEAWSTQPGETRRDNRFIVIRPDGTGETVLVLRGLEVIVTRSGRTYVPESVLFGRNSYLAPSAAGFVAGESDSFELRRRSWDGRLVTIIRKSGPARTVTDAELMMAEANADTVQQQILRIAGRAARGLSSSADTKPPHRSTHPYFDALMVDATEHVWVRQSSLGAATKSWLVFDPGGIWLGAISLPSNLRVTDIGPDYILGIYQDDLGVQSVRLYALDRRHGAQRSFQLSMAREPYEASRQNFLAEAADSRRRLALRSPCSSERLHGFFNPTSLVSVPKHSRGPRAAEFGGRVSAGKFRIVCRGCVCQHIE
jgi:hypothetical protein